MPGRVLVRAPDGAAVQPKTHFMQDRHDGATAPAAFEALEAGGDVMKILIDCNGQREEGTT